MLELRPVGLAEVAAALSSDLAVACLSPALPRKRWPSWLVSIKAKCLQP
jgi:hypothetical protein